MYITHMPGLFFCFRTLILAKDCSGMNTKFAEYISQIVFSVTKKYTHVTFCTKVRNSFYHNHKLLLNINYRFK